MLSATEYDGRIAKRDMGTPAVLMMNSNALLPASAVASRPELVPNDNLLHVKSPAYSKLVKNVTGATTPAAQKKALHAYNAYFLDQAFTVPLITRPTLTVRSTSVGSIAPTQTGFLNLGQAWLSEPKG